MPVLRSLRAREYINIPRPIQVPEPYGSFAMMKARTQVLKAPAWRGLFIVPSPQPFQIHVVGMRRDKH